MQASVQGARAEEKVSWLHEKLQETGTFLQNEKLEHERSPEGPRRMVCRAVGILDAKGVHRCLTPRRALLNNR